jgi:hypothetical protein
MAHWIIIEAEDVKTAALVNLDLVPHIEKTAEGRVLFHIGTEHTININPGKGAEKVWEYLVQNTSKKS